MDFTNDRGFLTLKIHGYDVVFDICDFDLLTRYSWHPNDRTIKNIYFSRTENLGGNKYSHTRLHREIMKASKGQIVDHINGDALDNRRCNLRFANVFENQWNKITKPGRSGVTGIAITRNGKFKVTLSYFHKTKVYGTYKTMESAVSALEYYLFKYHGEFSRIHSRRIKYVK